jgi:pyruvate dehydrogenase E2 component (dihydrolipoamide acetyltransferase)
MATEIKLPPLGENLTAGDVLDVRVAAGDVVSKGQPLVEIEAEKSTVEVPAPVDGKITEVRVQKGERIEVGQVLALVEAGDGKKAEAPKPAAPAKEKRAEPEPPRPSKPAEEPRPAAQKPEKPERQPEKPEKREGNGQQRAEPKATPAPAKPDGEKLVPAGPATRRLARELGVELSQVRGSAPGGRVTQEDVKAFVRDLTAGGAAPVRVAAPGAAPPLPDFERWGPVERRALDGVRRKTAEQMSLAWSQIPHVTQHDVADITELEAFRKQQDGKGPKLTVTAFALKAAAIVLRQFPQFNSSLDLAGNQLIVKNYYHLGVAVDTERGLLVPVVRDVDKKSVRELAQELTELAERARQKKVPLEELKGGTFTITNLGGIGGTAFTPIVNYPEVAILGLSRGRLQPVVRDGQVVPRLMLPLSLSYDHRVIDGADAARFTRRLAEMLEQPLVMLLDA